MAVLLNDLRLTFSFLPFATWIHKLNGSITDGKAEWTIFLIFLDCLFKLFEQSLQMESRKDWLSSVQQKTPLVIRDWSCRSGSAHFAALLQCCCDQGRAGESSPLRASRLLEGLHIHKTTHYSPSQISLPGYKWNPWTRDPCSSGWSRSPGLRALQIAVKVGKHRHQWVSTFKAPTSAAALQCCCSYIRNTVSPDNWWVAETRLTPKIVHTLEIQKRVSAMRVVARNEKCLFIITSGILMCTYLNLKIL